MKFALRKLLNSATRFLPRARTAQQSREGRTHFLQLRKRTCVLNCPIPQFRAFSARKNDRCSESSTFQDDTEWSQSSTRPTRCAKQRKRCFHAARVGIPSSGKRLSERQMFFYRRLIGLKLKCDEEFPINFDDLWQCVGYSRKDNAKRMLENFQVQIEYVNVISVDKIRNRPGPRENMLTLDCAQKLAMRGDTDVGKEVSKK